MRSEIRTQIVNIPSQKAAEKSGALREGVLRKRLVIGGNFTTRFCFPLCAKILKINE